MLVRACRIERAATWREHQLVANNPRHLACLGGGVRGGGLQVGSSALGAGHQISGGLLDCRLRRGGGVTGLPRELGGLGLRQLHHIDALALYFHDRLLGHGGGVARLLHNCSSLGLRCRHFVDALALHLPDCRLRRGGGVTGLPCERGGLGLRHLHHVDALALHLNACLLGHGGGVTRLTHDRGGLRLRFRHRVGALSGRLHDWLGRRQVGPLCGVTTGRREDGGCVGQGGGGERQ